MASPTPIPWQPVPITRSSASSHGRTPSPGKYPIGNGSPPILSLLQQCSSPRELSQIHAQLLKSNAIQDPLYLSKLLSFYASLEPDGDPSHALRLFSSLSYRDSAQWNSLIHGFSLGSTPEQSILLFIRLLEEDPILLNSYSFPPVLKACTRIMTVSEGIQIHGLATKCGAVADPYVQNSLVRMYFGCGRSRDGQLLFDKMPERSVVAWSCVIGGYAELGLWERVKSLFRMMVSEFHCVPNSVTLVRVITACVRSGDFELGKWVHQYIKENGVPLCLNLRNALMNMYAKFGEMGEARRLFDQMPEHDIVSRTTLLSGYASMGHLTLAHEIFDKMPDRNVVAWNAMIAGYVLNGCFEEAILLYKEMLALNVEIDKATMISVLSACAKSGYLLVGEVIHGYIYKVGIEMTLDLLHSILGVYSRCGKMDLAELLFSKMDVKNEISWTLMMVGYVTIGEIKAALETFNQMPHKDLAAWNALISTLAQCNYFSEALDIFEKMQRTKVSPNCFTLVSILSACARVGALELGKWVHAYIERNDIEMDAYLGSSLIDMYAKCGCINLSLEVFNRMPTKDLLSWSTMIVGLAMHGHSEYAIEFFRQMEDYGVQPDAVTFVGVLSACSHAGLVEEGQHYFDMMSKKYGITPTTDHYSCMVDLFGRHGLLKEAKEFIDKMNISSSGEAIWGALLGACKLHGNVELAEYATSHLVEVDPNNSGAHVLLSNVYASAYKWDDVGKVRNIMKKKGIEKVPGCSSIEVDGEIHEFFAGDASHPLSREIYMTLNRLEKLVEANIL
uniref:Pentatricopeptide repeat-containing protein At1g31430 n=1 Tax=Elaeis guineensis var. tenera TaxID=51953 RepID=A0A6I9RHX6_ELAGV|nr:pentatricopeptide repeat-containing protein At1g31430 [Elaeis guineensis]